MRGTIQSNGMARVNLNHAQATALAGRLIDALENNQDATVVPPPYDYRGELTRIIAKGLGIEEAMAAEGLGVRGGGRQRQGRG
jgi:hypothetical protein